LPLSITEKIGSAIVPGTPRPPSPGPAAADEDLADAAARRDDQPGNRMLAPEPTRARVEMFIRRAEAGDI